MGESLDRMFGTLRRLVLEVVQIAGPWAYPGLAALVVLLLLTFRARVVSLTTLFVILALTLLAVTIRAVQLGRL